MAGDPSGAGAAAGEAVPRRQKKRSDPPAVAAARAADLDALRALPVEEVREARDHNGCGCLHWAAGDGRLALCEFLVADVGISVHAPTWNRRTPLHYAARNGRLDVCRWLVEHAGARPNELARDDVSPFQMACWQGHGDVCRYLVEQAGVDPRQVNRFNCTAGHWLGLAPKERVLGDGVEAFISLARWLREQGVDFTVQQEQGHNGLHKAAWAGHIELCRWLRDECGLLDALPDKAGNYAADLAEQAGHLDVAAWLRAHCSGKKAASCALLGVALDADEGCLRAAYLRRVRETHPDSRRRPRAEEAAAAPDAGGVADFSALHQAYRHLTVERGAGDQRNAKHSLQLMLPWTDTCAEAGADSRCTRPVACG